MFTIQNLQKRLADVPNLRPLAVASGLSEKTIYRVSSGKYSSITLTTANKILAALDSLYPEAKSRKSKRIDAPAVAQDGI